MESPSCLGRLLKLMVFRLSHAGVPVCKRPSLNPAAFKDADKPTEGALPSLPVGKHFIPG